MVNMNLKSIRLENFITKQFYCKYRPRVITPLLSSRMFSLCLLGNNFFGSREQKCVLIFDRRDLPLNFKYFYIPKLTKSGVRVKTWWSLNLSNSHKIFVFWIKTHPNENFLMHDLFRLKIMNTHTKFQK